MPTIHLHIGAPKTGSTTIQSFMALNRAALLDRGWIFPTSTGVDQSSTLVTYAVRAAESEGAIEREALGEAFLNEVAASGATAIFLSCEALSSRLRSTEAIERLRALLARIGETKILVYMRRQDEAALSYLWNAVLDGPGRLAFPPSEKTMATYDYAALIQRWAGVFGEASVQARRFGPAYAADLIADFSGAVGLDPAGLVRPKSRNVSPDARSLAFLDLLSPYLEGWSKADRAGLVRRLDGVDPGPKFGAGRNEREELLRRFEATNRWTAEWLGLPGPLFDHPVPDDAVEPLTVADILPRVAHLLADWPRQVAKPD